MNQIISNQNIAILQDYIARKNEVILENGISMEIHNEIIERIKGFNFDQKYSAIHAQKNYSFGDIFDVYADNHSCLQAEYKRATYPTYTYSIIYKNHKLKFSDFCRYGLKNFDYNLLKDFFSTVCYYLFESIKQDSNLFNTYLVNKTNPYKCSSIISIIDRNLTVEDFKSVSSIKRIICVGVSRIFKTDFFLSSSKTIKLLAVLVSNRESVYDIINSFFYKVIELRRRIDCNEVVDEGKKISRHVSWCVYENNRICFLLNQHCYSSVGCALYKGMPYKRKWFA